MVLRNWKRLLSVVLLASVLVACGSESSDSNVGIFKGAPESGGGSSSGGGGNSLVVDTGGAADLKFAETSLKATTGDIKVTFNNKGAIPHNWVLVKPGEEQKILDESAKDTTNYTAPSAIAHTNLLQPGKSEDITFNIADAGTYEYICTFPGHFAAGMKGTLEVTAGSGAPAAGGETGGAPAAGGGSVTVDSADAATMKFSKDAYDFPAGDVQVTFNNKGAIPHNAVIVKPGDEQKAVDEGAANSPSYAPKSAIAHSNMLNGGQSETFSAKLDPGTYTLLCTFPGHYAVGMKATITVK